MRVLLVSALDPERSDVPKVAAALAARGHEPRVAAFERPLGQGAAREAAVAALVGKEALMSRPKVAMLEASPHASATAAALRTARIPYLIWANEAFVDADQGAEGDPSTRALPLTFRGAAGVVVGSAAVAEHVVRAAGIEEMELLEAGVDLEALPLGDRAEARAALGLPPDVRILGLVGALSADTGLDLLSLAHRQLAGVALLIAGDGPEESAVFAMSAATRPSAPVVHVGPLAPATRVVTACAADVGLALDRRGPSPESWSFAALGRRQVTFDVPGTDAIAAIYPEHRTVFAAPEHPDAFREVLEAALAEEATAGPLPAEAVDAARRTLDQATRWTRLAERVLSCA